MYVGIEPEFMLLSRDESGKLGPSDATDTLDKPCYDYKGLSRTSAVLDDITDALRAVGIDVYQIDHEDANGQFEVNFTYADALKSADNFTFVKMAASEIARKHGMIATFMPKPFSNRTGSGAHFHISIGNEKQKNLFEDKSDKRGLSLSTHGLSVPGGRAGARACAGGGVRTHREFVQAPGRRTLAVGRHLGAGLCRLRRQQSHGLRAHPGRATRDCACRTPAAIPYLALAAVVAAGLDGIDRKLDPGEPTNLNMYELVGGAIGASARSRCCRRTCSKRWANWRRTR